MPRTLWWSADGKIMADLGAIVFTEWKGDAEEPDDRELDVTFAGDNSYSTTLNLKYGTELTQALRRHAGWPEGSPYRG